MKFRLVLIVALLLGAAALSGLTAYVHVTVTGPTVSSNAYLRVFYQGATPPPFTVVALPAPQSSTTYEFELSDLGPSTTLVAQLECGAPRSALARVTFPHFFFTL